MIRYRWTTALVALALAGCTRALVLTPSDAATVLNRQALEAPDPGAPGPHEVLTLYYGSGTDKNRPEYRDSVAIRTPTVDASKLVSLGRAAESRTAYWGFGPTEMPLNGRVWYPEGDGPFPLVLVVHGNHDMRDFSDPGYDYLGELLASRGYILVSVDENFINGLNDENDARGWFLLKHIELFEGFNAEAGNPFGGKVDMSAIALIGHSRGGEAVANAVAFNRLPRYPDDATVEFDFGYDIRGVVSIAPVDGQYLPTGRKVVMEDVSYLTFHGSHDGDVTSFHGLRIYDRIRWTDPNEFHFKSAVYVYRANHGQWNSVWGSGDFGPRSGRILDLRALMPPEDQRRFAEIYVSAFMEAVLKDNHAYLPIFRDHRVAGEWLPGTMYVTRFETSADRSLADFEEDFDVTTGSATGVTLLGEGLSTWQELELQLRSNNRPTTSRSQENQVVKLGWRPAEAGGEDRDAGEASDTPAAGAPSYALGLGDRLAARWALGSAHTLLFDLAPTDREPRGETEAGGDGGAPDGVALDLSVEVEDVAGRTARVPLSAYGAVRRPLVTYVMRRPDQECGRCTEPWDLMLQSYAIPLADFTAAAPGLDLRQLAVVRFVFDRSPEGEVVLDRVAISELEPAFWAARLGG